MPHRVGVSRIQKKGKLRVERLLSHPGRVLVQPGQIISADDIIGQIIPPGSFRIVNVAQVLGLSETQVRDEPGIEAFLLKKENDPVEKDDILAQVEGRFSFLGKVCKSPTAGRLAVIAGQWILIETNVDPQPVQALVPGRVVEIYPDQGIVIETTGAYVDAVFGFGGEAFGLLQSVSDDIQADIDQVDIDQVHTNQIEVPVSGQKIILMAGGTISEAAIRQAESASIAGFIVGSLDASLLEMDPPPSMPIIVTEGFGHRPMASDTWRILQSRLKTSTFICGLMPSVTSPGKSVIIVPGRSADNRVGEEKDDPPAIGRITIGSHVRNVREPDVMTWGQVSAIQDQPQITATDIAYAGADVHFPQGIQFVPWFNLEKIEAGE